MPPIASPSSGTRDVSATPRTSGGWPLSCARAPSASSRAPPSRSTARVPWASCDARGGTSVMASERGRALGDRDWEGLLERDPLMGTFIGDERYDDRLPDIGAAGRAEEE